MFVVDYDDCAKGRSADQVLVNDPDKRVGEVTAGSVSFQPGEDAHDAAQAFERYDLISRRLWMEKGRLIDRLTIDIEMVGLIRERERSALTWRSAREDIFASVWKSVGNRWAWLAINLIGFIASRVIGLFRVPSAGGWLP